MPAVFACARLAYAGEIHDATRKGDVEKIKVPVQGRTELVNAEDNYSGNALYYAAAFGGRAPEELCLAHKPDLLQKHKAL